MTVNNKITVYDQFNEIVGETFQRRAKQLVLKGRAKWADNAQTAICLLESAEYPKEEKSMETYGNDQEHKEYIDLREPAEKVDTSSEDLLLYIAKQNVEKLRNLKINIIALPIAAFLLMFLREGFGVRLGGVHLDFFIGIFALWSVIIVHKFVKYLQTRPSSRHKGDPIKEEYERLKRQF